MRSKKALYSAIASFILQIILIITNLVIPHFIIQKYGSETNGVVNSIINFLSYIALLEGGIGGVIRAIFYKTLVKKDKKELSTVVVSVQKFFRRICIGLIIYVIVLCIIYPTVIASQFNPLFTMSLLAIIAISSFAQYFFGLINQILLQSDQKGYIVSITKIIAYVLSTAVMLCLMFHSADIRLVELSGTIILSAPAICYYFYVKKHYDLDYDVPADKKVLRQRWDGFAHQISAFIHANTDVALLSFFSSMSEVSVYSIYALVTSGLKSILNTFVSSISAAFGNLYANKETQKLAQQFKLFNYFNIIIVIFCFTIAAVFIAPFVNIYANTTDANYFRPIFGAILVAAEAIYCLRCSYSNIIFVVGDFKQTKKHGYIEAIINIVVSSALLSRFGLSGIAVGTAVGMCYRWIISMIYVHKRIIKLEIGDLMKKHVVNICAAISAVIFTLKVINPLTKVNDFASWAYYAAIFGSVLLATMFFANLLFCNRDVKNLYDTYIRNFIGQIRKEKK